MSLSRQSVRTGTIFLRRVWSLALPYFCSDQWRMASALLVAIVALTLGSVYLSVQFNTWNRDFYDALQERDFDAFKRLILYFCGLAAVAIVVAVYRLYLTQMLEMRWR